MNIERALVIDKVLALANEYMSTISIALHPSDNSIIRLYGENINDLQLLIACIKTTFGVLIVQQYGLEFSLQNGNHMMTIKIKTGS